MNLITGFSWKTRVSDTMHLQTARILSDIYTPDHRKLIHRALIVREKII